MEIKNKLKLFCTCFLLGGSILYSSCSSREETIGCFPEQNINVVLNLKLPAYDSELENKKRLYIDEQQSGTRGLILVRMGVSPNYTFKVYDRNAPHICPDTNTTLQVEGGTKIICPKDGAEWILNTGQPIKVSGVAPKIYNYSYEPRTGVISIYY